MTDIFDEVTAELRRDQSSALWRRYGRYVIGAAVAVVLIVASVIAYDSWKTAGQEAASERYDALLKTLEATPEGDAREALIEKFLAKITAAMMCWPVLCQLLNWLKTEIN